MGNEVKTPIGIVRGYVLPYPPTFEKAKILPDTNKIMDKFLRSFAKMVSDLRIKDENSLKKFCDIFVCGVIGSFSNRKYKFVKKYLKRNNCVQKYEIKSFQNALRYLPADTRVVGNTASLLIHLLASSGVACAMAKTRGIGGTDYQILRCVALFHDIGKPFYSSKNEDVGKKKFKKNFSDLFSEELLNKVLHLIETWRTPVEKLGQILKSASEFSVATNQLKDITAELEEKFFEKKVWDPIAIQTLKLKEATTKYLEEKDEIWNKKINEIAPKFKEDESSEVALVFGDASGIKKYVDRSNTIYEIIGGSNKVKNGINDAVDHVLEKGLIEPENIIFFGGGSIHLTCSSAVVSEVERSIKDSFRSKARGVNIVISSVKPPLQNPPPFGVIWNYLCRKNRRDKDTEERKRKAIIGIARLCESCHEQLATEEYREYLYCRSCAEKAIEGKKLAERPPPPVSDHMPEFLAGHGVREIAKDEIEEYLNLAVIKADGNLSGNFFALSPSLSEIVEKSVRLEQAMDETQTEIREICSLDEVYEWRFDIGMVYSAGDDFLLFAPSFIAYPIALNLVTRFYEKMGRTCRLAVGIAAADPLYPIQSLMETAEEEIRMAKAEDAKIRFNKKEEWAGTLSYEVVIGGAFSGRLAESTLRTLKRKNMSVRPLVVFDEQRKKDPRNALTLARETLKIDNPFSIKEYFDRFNQLREGREEHEWRQIQRRLLTIASIIDVNKEKVEGDRRLAILASMRQYARLDRDEGYLNAFEFLEPPAITRGSALAFQKPARIFDAMTLLKLCGGGIL